MEIKRFKSTLAFPQRKLEQTYAKLRKAGRCYLCQKDGAEYFEVFRVAEPKVFTFYAYSICEACQRDPESETKVLTKVLGELAQEGEPCSIQN